MTLLFLIFFTTMITSNKVNTKTKAFAHRKSACGGWIIIQFQITSQVKFALKFQPLWTHENWNTNAFCFLYVLIQNWRKHPHRWGTQLCWNSSSETTDHHQYKHGLVTPAASTHNHTQRIHTSILSTACTHTHTPYPHSCRGKFTKSDHQYTQCIHTFKHTYTHTHYPYSIRIIHKI